MVQCVVSTEETLSALEQLVTVDRRRRIT